MGNDKARFHAPGAPPEVAEVLARLATVIADLALTLQVHGLSHDPVAALDPFADRLFRDTLRGAPVRYLASEQNDAVLDLEQDGSLALAIVPLDGASDIDMNVPLGTIFSIFPAAQSGPASFLRPAHEQIAAGYAIYGPQCTMVVTWGAGVHAYGLEPRSKSFQLIRSHMQIPADVAEYSIDASDRHWSAPAPAYIGDCIAGADGPRARDLNMRWIASLVAETHRVMIRGGIFLCPSNGRKASLHGRLHHVFLCAPIAFLMGQGGGSATDGSDPILERTPETLHARSPLVFGSAGKVARVSAYHDLPAAETSALFGSRGLFRS